MMQKFGKLMTPKETSAYLRERWGIKRHPNTLAELRTGRRDRRGPKFLRDGRRVLYAEAHVDEWAATKLGKPIDILPPR